LLLNLNKRNSKDLEKDRLREELRKIANKSDEEFRKTVKDPASMQDAANTRE
jgi:hypothetical protein